MAREEGPEEALRDLQLSGMEPRRSLLKPRRLAPTAGWCWLESSLGLIGEDSELPSSEDLGGRKSPPCPDHPGWRKLGLLPPLSRAEEQTPLLIGLPAHLNVSYRRRFYHDYCVLLF